MEGVGENFNDRTRYTRGVGRQLPMIGARADRRFLLLKGGEATLYNWCSRETPLVAFEGWGGDAP